MSEIQSMIIEKLEELEKTNQIKILLACETGSRGWGFPSPDSDYDVRFIYVHDKDWYLSVNEPEDQISLPINSELDITGWELRKCLRLLMKHNAALMERLQSPIIYKETTNFKEEFFQIARNHFSSISVMHHYLSMAKSYFEKCSESENAKLKSLFYCIRTTLTCHWILEKKSIPPMELEKLLPIISSQEVLVKKIRELVELKSSKDESYLHPNDEMVMEYLRSTILDCEDKIKNLPGQKYPIDTLNDFLRKYIR